MNNNMKAGMYGLIVGDALGVPFEFSSRESLMNNPVSDMEGYGSFNMPKGTWSDDSSMALATLDSIRRLNAVDYEDIMNCFSDWLFEGAYTPFDVAFDVGNTTYKAIFNYIQCKDPLKSGLSSEMDNGNGSLMRILPVCIFLAEQQRKSNLTNDECIDIIHNASALTHAHLRSKIACGIYFFLVKSLIENEGKLHDLLQQGISEALLFYEKNDDAKEELKIYTRIFDLKKFKEKVVPEIKSSGYVVDTLEASIWCLLNSNTYKEAVLLAVNLGSDTDTVAAVTGGLAGVYYGIDYIPEKWIEDLQNRELLVRIIE